MSKTPAQHARYAEMITETARTWCAHSLDNAYRRAGVEVPVSGDKLAALAVGPAHQLRLYRDRDRPMDRYHAALDEPPALF